MRNIFALSLLVLLSLVNSQPDGDCNPTPQTFPTLFLDGCVALGRINTTCDGYWSAFSSAFANTDPSGITTEYVFTYSHCIVTATVSANNTDII